MNIVIKSWDCTIVCGFRGPEAQNKAFNEGKSKLTFPSSFHNKYPSMAVDVMPYHNSKPHIHWDDDDEIIQFARFVQGVAAGLGLKLVWGGDFNENWEFGDDSFIDSPHYRLELEEGED
jgi:hypothetical protein